MRTITTHQTNPVNLALTITVLDEPSDGGASYSYDITGFPGDPLKIRLQRGPRSEGVNGITHEVLLAIVEDHLRSFQAGEFASEKNAEALAAVQLALEVKLP